MEKLANIAADLKSAAETTGQPARRHLSRGLSLAVVRTKTEWQLSLTRKGVAPSQAEEYICRQAFGAPEEVEREQRHERGYVIVRLRWPVARQAVMEGIE